jgi:hypothetical protein
MRFVDVENATTAKSGENARAQPTLRYAGSKEQCARKQGTVKMANNIIIQSRYQEHSICQVARAVVTFYRGWRCLFVSTA